MNKFLKNASSIQFLTIEEKEGSVCHKNSFIVGNGADLPQLFENKKTNNIINFIFIGRIAVDHKGLDLMIEAINSCKSELRNKKCIFNLYGDDFRGGKNILNKMIKKYELEDFVKLNDSIFGEKKYGVLKESDIFIMTSRYEGQPMALLEAMAYELPVIITPGTNMIEKIKNNDCGLVCSGDIESIKNTLLEAVKLSKTELKIKGKNSRQLVEKEYSWGKIANDSVEIYREIVEGKKNDTI